MIYKSYKSKTTRSFFFLQNVGYNKKLYKRTKISNSAETRIIRSHRYIIYIIVYYINYMYNIILNTMQLQNNFINSNIMYVWINLPRWWAYIDYVQCIGIVVFNFNYCEHIWRKYIYPPYMDPKYPCYPNNIHNNFTTLRGVIIGPLINSFILCYYFSISIFLVTAFLVHFLVTAFLYNSPWGYIITIWNFFFNFY
jgi:hypothetical protein